VREASEICKAQDSVYAISGIGTYHMPPVDNPHTRVKLAERDISHYLIPKFDESDLFLFTSRALGAIKYAKVHDLWSGVLLGRLSE